jgi:hypothetical protein
VRPTAATVSDCYRLRRGPRALTALALLGCVIVFVTGCGGSSIGVANISNSALPGRHAPSSRRAGGGVRFVGVAASPAQRAGAEVAGLLFSRCMRAHGVPDFPDPPSAAGGAIRFGFGAGGLDPAAPLFRKAERVCISFLSRRRAGVG